MAEPDAPGADNADDASEGAQPATEPQAEQQAQVAPEAPQVELRPPTPLSPANLRAPEVQNVSSGPPAPHAPRRRSTVHTPADLVPLQRPRERRNRTWYGERAELGVTHDFKDDDVLDNPAVSAPAEPDPDFSQAGPLSLKTRVEYSSMPKNAMQAVFGLVTVEAAAADVNAEGTATNVEAERKPMDLVCVLDVSGSMGSQNKIEELKSAVRFIINESLPADRLSLVTFQSSASRVLRLRRMDREGQDEATVATLRMAAGGGTLIASGLELGLQVLEQRRQRNKVCAILLLTDGQDHSCRAHLPQLLQRASKMGCGIYPFGFGKDHDSVLLRELSERAKTPFTYIEETSAIKEAFAGVVGGLSSIVAQQVQVTLRCHARLKEVNTPFEVLRHSDQTATVTIPDIFAEERRDILVELEVPADSVAEETVLLEASAQYVAVREAAEVRVQTPVVAMSVQRVDEPQPEQEPDEEVFEQRQRWEVTSVMEEASRRSDQGDFEEARQLLNSKRQTLRESRPSRTTQALQLELEDAESRMRNFGTWTLGSHEVRDATTMHLMQRTTNTIASCSLGGEAKTSKSLYVSSIQSASIRRSTVAGHEGPASASGLAAMVARDSWRGATEGFEGKGKGKGKDKGPPVASQPAASAADSLAPTFGTGPAGSDSQGASGGASNPSDKSCEQS